MSILITDFRRDCRTEKLRRHTLTISSQIAAYLSRQGKEEMEVASFNAGALLEVCRITLKNAGS